MISGLSWSSWFGFLYETGGSLGFGYRGETCEFWLVLAEGVRPVSLWPLVKVGNLGAV
jgi:hypothetical protein